MTQAKNLNKLSARVRPKTNAVGWCPTQRKIIIINMKKKRRFFVRGRRRQAARRRGKLGDWRNGDKVQPCSLAPGLFCGSWSTQRYNFAHLGPTKTLQPAIEKLSFHGQESRLAPETRKEKHEISLPCSTEIRDNPPAHRIPSEFPFVETEIFAPEPRAVPRRSCVRACGSLGL